MTHQHVGDNTKPVTIDEWDGGEGPLDVMSERAGWRSDQRYVFKKWGACDALNEFPDIHINEDACKTVQEHLVDFCTREGVGNYTKSSATFEDLGKVAAVAIQGRVSKARADRGGNSKFLRSMKSLNEILDGWETTVVKTIEGVPFKCRYVEEPNYDY